MTDEILSEAVVKAVAERVVAAVDTPQVSTRYSTREEVEQTRQDRDAAVAAALDRELAIKRAELMDMQLDRRFAALESRMRLPNLTISLPGGKMDPHEVGEALKSQLADVVGRVTILEGNTGANYFKVRS